MNHKTMAQTLALLFGAVFVLVGILGFIPGITTNYGDMTFAGQGSGAELLGIFQVSILHNIAHLLFGVGILAAKKHSSAVQYLLFGGLVYVVLFVYGLIVSEGSSANFIPVNNADDVLHIVLALALLGGWAATRNAGPDANRDRIEPIRS